MKLKELKDTIIGNGGKLTVSDIYFTLEDDGDVNIHAEDVGLIAWIMKSAEDAEEVSKQVQVIGDNSFKALPAQMRLAQYLGVNIVGFEPITVEKVVEKENIDHLKLSGMVEAYEKILIGREITASR